MSKKIFQRNIENLLPVNVNSKDGVTPAAVLVHVMSSDRAILQPLLQHSQQVVQLRTFDAGE